MVAIRDRVQGVARRIDDGLDVWAVELRGPRRVLLWLLMAAWWVLKTALRVVVITVNVLLAFLELAKPPQNVDHAESTVARLINRMLPAKLRMFPVEMDDWLDEDSAEEKRRQILSWLRGLPRLLWTGWSDVLFGGAGGTVPRTGAQPPTSAVAGVPCAHPPVVLSADGHPPPFRVSSYQAPGGGVEVAMTPDGVLVRDGKNPTRPAMLFSAHEWRAFLASIGKNEPQA